MKATLLGLAASVFVFWCAGSSADTGARALSSSMTPPATETTLAAALATAAGAAVTCSAVSAKPSAVVCALADDAKARSTAPRGTAPRVSVFSVLFLTDEALAAALLEDVARQTIAPATELLVGLVTGFFSQANVAQLGREMGRRRLHSLKVVLWHTDLGLYGCWSYLCAHVATAEYRTNWNPDDRRAPYALQKQAALLDTKPQVDLVAGPVRQLNAGEDSPVNATWATTHDAKVLRLVGGKHGPLPRALQLSDFGRFAAGRFSVANPPHNAPMFRKRLTDTVGYFDSSLDPLSDWELWVRGIINGSTYWFLEQPVIVWAKSEIQYSATHAGSRDAAVARVLAQNCAAWQRALSPAVCTAGVVSRKDAEPTPAAGVPGRRSV